MRFTRDTSIVTSYLESYARWWPSVLTCDSSSCRPPSTLNFSQTTSAVLLCCRCRAGCFPFRSVEKVAICYRWDSYFVCSQSKFNFLLSLNYSERPESNEHSFIQFILNNWATVLFEWLMIDWCLSFCFSLTRWYTSPFHLKSSPHVQRKWIPDHISGFCRVLISVTLLRNVVICSFFLAVWQRFPPSRRPVRFMPHTHVAGSSCRCTALCP